MGVKQSHEKRCRRVNQIPTGLALLGRNREAAKPHIADRIVRRAVRRTS